MPELRERTMAKQVRYVLVVPLLSIAALLTTPATSAIAQGCTEQLAQDFLAGWSHDLPKLMPLSPTTLFMRTRPFMPCFMAKMNCEISRQAGLKRFPT
jgi:hypothetical protein